MPRPDGNARSSVIMALVIAVEEVVSAIWAMGNLPAVSAGATDVPVRTDTTPVRLSPTTRSIRVMPAREDATTADVF